MTLSELFGMNKKNFWKKLQGRGAWDGTEKGPLDGQLSDFQQIFSGKRRLEGTSEIFEKNKVQGGKWPVPSNGPL